MTTPSSGTVRDHLVRALEADLVGPFEPSADAEVSETLKLPPSRWYLTGFLAPAAGRVAEEPPDDELGAGSDQSDLDGTDQEPAPKRSNLLPASMGLSVLLTADATAVRATVSFAEYEPEEVEEADGRRRTYWRRVERPPIEVDVPLGSPEIVLELVGTGGVYLRGRLEPAVPGDDPGTLLPPGTLALALFVVNEREPGPQGRKDARFLFQIRLELFCEEGFVPRPNRTGETSDDWDAKVGEIQYRDRFEHAVGHGVSVEVVPEADGRAAGGPVRRVRTTWLPRAEVKRVKTRDLPGVETAMKALGALADGAAARAALEGLVMEYGRWIDGQAVLDPESAQRRETQEVLVAKARKCQERIAEGIDLVASDPEVLDAFRLANRAMSLVRRRIDEDPKWRLFQLAFLLMNLPSVTDPHHKYRDTVELIFFPTGGGKTEAYLGVIAYTLVLRRMRGRERPDGGLGVAILLRYTLRLLTLDQLGRAAGLICALERIREEREDLGDVRFSIGLWVGRSATENTLARLAPKVSDYKLGKTKLSPVPLTHCPWCGSELKARNIFLEPNASKPTEVIVGCDFPCEFSRGKNPEGLPLLFIDEQIYRELPSFVVATVDKLAMLPWRGETGMLFGRATARDGPLGGKHGRRFFGPMDKPPADAEPLADGLLPPELIVQDELHLISGPLGTMVGLYETTIDRLCRRGKHGDGTRAKVLASTATVQRADAQTKSLFDRPVKLFPPPGVDASETFFAEVDDDSPGRLYLGVAAPGRAMKAVLIRVYVALLAAANRLYDAGLGSDQEADGYMTIAGYFNSLRELGGMRRLVEDEVRSRASDAEERQPEDTTGRHPWFRNRRIGADPVELTSREPTAKIGESKARLARPHSDTKSRVDVLLASNMISVGVDIDRLGLMVVAGQPKTTSEYIQASSRVGRDGRWPGLVVTCLNHFKPRDRSHYERFATYHESFYRFVEPTSLTPFSAPALDRGLAANLVAMTRLVEPSMTPPSSAMDIAARRDLAEEAAEALADRASHWIQDKEESQRCREDVLARARNVIDAWVQLAAAAAEGSGQRSYSPYDRERPGAALLRTSLASDGSLTSDDAKFKAPTSMRDVEESTHLWLDFKHRVRY